MTAGIKLKYIMLKTIYTEIYDNNKRKTISCNKELKATTYSN